MSVPSIEPCCFSVQGPPAEVAAVAACIKLQQEAMEKYRQILKVNRRRRPRSALATKKALPGGGGGCAVNHSTVVFVYLYPQ